MEQLVSKFHEAILKTNRANRKRKKNGISKTNNLSVKNVLKSDMQKLCTKFELCTIPSVIDGFPKVIAQKKAVVE